MEVDLFPRIVAPGIQRGIISLSVQCHSLAGSWHNFGKFFIIFFTLKLTVMPGTKRSIGGQGLEQGGPDLGNDISRNISREVQADDTTAPVIKDKDKNKKENNSKSKGEQANPQQQNESDDEIAK